MEVSITSSDNYTQQHKHLIIKAELTNIWLTDMNVCGLFHYGNREYDIYDMYKHKCISIS